MNGPSENARTFLLLGLRAGTLVIKFVLTLFVARYLGIEALGLYGLIAAACIMAPSLLGFGLMYTVSRKAVMAPMSETATALGEYARFISSLYLVLSLMVIGYGICSGHTLMACMVIALVFLEHLNNELYTLLLNLSHSFVANGLHFVRSSLWALVFMCLTLAEPEWRTVNTLLLGWLCGSCLAFLLFISFARNWPWQSLSLIPSRSWFQSEFRVSRTIYLYGIIFSSGQYLYHVLITLFLGLEMTGVYVFFVQTTGAMANLLQTGVIQLARPKLVQAWQQHSETYPAIYQACLKRTACLSILMAALSYPVLYMITLYIVDKPRVKEWFVVFIPILSAFVAAILKEVNDLVFYSQHRDRIILKLSLITITCGVLMGSLSIPTLGLWGAALTLLIVNVSTLIYQFRLIQPLLLQGALK